MEAYRLLPGLSFRKNTDAPEAERSGPAWRHAARRESLGERRHVVATTFAYHSQLSSGEGTRMRTAEGSQNRRRSQITATSIYLVLVVVPILGAMLVAWQVGTRPRAVQPDPGPAPAPPAPAQAAPVPAQPPAALPAATGTGSTTASLSEPSPPPSVSTPLTNGFLPNPTTTAALTPRMPEPDQPTPPPSVANAAPGTPSRTETSSLPAMQSASADAAAEPTATGKTLVDLNSASVEELNQLGAGRVGRAIVRGRPYTSAEDLVRKRVLNRSRFARIKDQVRVGRNLVEQ
jgi:hypothetical protein